MRTHLIIASFLALSLAACSSPTTPEASELNPIDLETPDLLESEVVLSATPAPWTGVKDLTTNFETATFSQDIATDANNNVFVPVKRDFNKIGVNPEYSLVKLDSGGNIVWTLKREIGTPNFVGAFSVATDPAGNVYLAGNTGINLEGQRLNGQQDAFVTKYNTNGKLVWTRLIGAGADDGATGVGVDSSGEVYASGWTCGTGQSLGGKVIRGGCDMFVTKFNNGGARRWVQLIGTDGNELAGTMSVVANGTVAVTGNTTAAFPGFSNPQAAETAFAAKLSSSGAIAWVKQFDGNLAADVTLDSAGNVVTYGNATTSELPRPQGVTGYLPILRKLRGSDGQRLWSALTPVNPVSTHFANHVKAGPGNVLYFSAGYGVFGYFAGETGRAAPDGTTLPGGDGNVYGVSFAIRGNNVFTAGYFAFNECRPWLYPTNCFNTIAKAAKYDLNLVQQ
jgi:hypothetical protein